MVPVAQRIHDNMATLSPQERRIARALMSDYPGIGLDTAATLAHASRASAPTVVRFARSLGFDGFAALQSALRTELHERGAGPVTRYAEAAADPTSMHWLDHGLQLACRSIGRSLSHIPHAEVDEAVEALADPRKTVTCAGGRYSTIVASYLAMHLQQLRPRVRSLAHTGDDTFDTASTIDATKNDVYVIYDVRRYQRSTVELARRLNRRGATIILITDPWLSPAAHVAHIVLPTSVDSASPFDSLAPAFVLSELLIGAVLTRLGDVAARRIAEFDEASTYETLP